MPRGSVVDRYACGPHSPDLADVAGEVEAEEGVLVIRRIHVVMRLVAPEGVRATVKRTHNVYAMRCPLYRTLHKTIQLTSSFELVAPPPAL